MLSRFFQTRKAIKLGYMYSNVLVSILFRVIRFAVIPLFLNNLEAYGFFMLVGLITKFQFISDLGQINSRNYSMNGKRNEEKLKIVKDSFGSILTLIFSSNILIATILYMYYQKDFMKYDFGYPTIIYFALFLTMSKLRENLSSSLVFLSDYKSMFKVETAYNFSAIVISGLGLHFFNMAGLIYSLIIPELLLVVYLLNKIRPIIQLNGKFSLKFDTKFLLNTFVEFYQSNIDVFLVTTILGLKALGIYSICLTLTWPIILYSANLDNLFLARLNYTKRMFKFILRNYLKHRLIFFFIYILIGYFAFNIMFTYVGTNYKVAVAYFPLVALFVIAKQLNVLLRYLGLTSKTIRSYLMPYTLHILIVILLLVVRPQHSLNVFAIYLLILELTVLFVFTLIMNQTKFAPIKR